VQGDEALVEEIARQCRVVVATRGAEGCTLFVDGSPHAIPAIPVEEVDPTGAGDVFAAAFFARLHATGDPGKAARFATFLAGRSVTRPGLDSIPTRQEIEAASVVP
jgi:sugar/nucleoside kinase (ribokinase family)